MDATRDLNVDDEDEYDPIVMDGENSRKKGSERDVTLSEPCLFHTMSQSQSCSDTASVDKCHD